MNKTDALAETIRELLAGQDLAILATRTKGAPHTSLVAFKVREDLRSLPCITGVPDATELIRNGDLLTVDVTWA